MKKLIFTVPSSKKLNQHHAEERKRDTRRKILIGAHGLEKAKQDNAEKELYAEMLNFLTREADRSLFHDLMRKETEH
jgi:hypothetical protein